MTDGLLAEIRNFLETQAAEEARDKSTLSPAMGATELLARLDKRLSIPPLEEHEWVLELEQDEDRPEVIVASLTVTEQCDRMNCACHVGSPSEWGIVEGSIPVNVKVTGGKFNSWHGEYDDTYITVSAREPEPAGCPLKNLPKVDPTDTGPKVVPLTTGEHIPPPNHYPHGVCETPGCEFPASGCGNGACGCMGHCRRCIKCNMDAMRSYT